MENYHFNSIQQQQMGVLSMENVLQKLVQMVIKVIIVGHVQIIIIKILILDSVSSAVQVYKNIHAKHNAQRFLYLIPHSIADSSPTRLSVRFFPLLFLLIDAEVIFSFIFFAVGV